MELNEQNLQQLATYLGQTLSPDPAVRRPGELRADGQLAGGWASQL